MKSEMPQYNQSISPSLNLINALIHLKEQGPWLPNHGICTNIYDFIDKEEIKCRETCLNDLDKAIEKWPSAYSFEDCEISDFPVGGMEEYHREAALGALWQNPRRLELLDFIIDYLNTEG